jgi:hypothetical protein
MTQIVQVNEHDGFRVLKTETGDWYYTKLPIEEGRYDLEMKCITGRWWVSKAEPTESNHKQLMSEFRERVKQHEKVRRNQSTTKG